VIEIDGADLRAEHLAEYLDGGVRVALVVNAPAPPAPLVRLISRGVLVLQTSDASRLETLAGATAPAVVALMPAGCAELLHDPRGGARLDARLTITLPASGRTDALGWRSARQARDELAQLEALAELCAAARDVALVMVPVANQGSETENVDSVTAWLLAQAGFTGGAA
jgi:hypothetical protein